MTQNENEKANHQESSHFDLSNSKILQYKPTQQERKLFNNSVNWMISDKVVSVCASMKTRTLNHLSSEYTQSAEHGRPQQDLMHVKKKASTRPWEPLNIFPCVW